MPVRLNTALTELYVEDGVVRGDLRARHEAGPESAEPELIRARRGVILGCGGFDHNEQMRVKYQRAPISTEWTVGAKANTGDGIMAGEKLGAALDIMEDAWWGPDCAPWRGRRGFALSERNSPGAIIVNMTAKRFMNESMPYVEACHNMYGGRVRAGLRTRREHPGLAHLRPAVSRPLYLRGTAAGPTDSEEVDGIRASSSRRTLWMRSQR